MILCTGHEIVMKNIVKASNCYLYDSDNKEYIDQVIKEENLIEKCSILGSHFLSQLQQLQKNVSIIKDIRGRGLMMAIEFEDKGNNVLASTIQRRLLSNGFIVANRPGFNVIRIDPPLTVSKKEIDSFIENFLQVICQ